MEPSDTTLETEDTEDTGEQLPPLSLTFEADRPATAGNPLQGFMTSYAWGQPVTDFPHSLEFVYIPLNELMDGPQSFTFESGLEPHLAAAAARGNQVVVRPTIDYPSQPSGLPEYLAEQVDQNSYTEHGGGLSPDYSDPDLRAALASFIQAFGEGYDGDPRIAFVQLGLVGFWGEWHTWPHSEWFPDTAVQNEVLHAYEDAFPTTHLQVRIPTADSPTLRIGFHDDSFAYSTVGEVDWFFHNQLVTAGADARWTQVPVGGELRPELQRSIFESSYQTGTYAQDFDACVTATHATYLLNYAAFGEAFESDDERQRTEEAALSLGYEFTLRSLEVEGTLATLTIENTGVAPFYYPLEVVLKTSGGDEKHGLDLQPAELAVLEFTVGDRPSDERPWTLSLESPHLLPSATLRFANTPTGSIELGGD